jgi:hypothetical protein
MNLSDKERTFLVRGLDKATTPDEADTCAKNFFKELRKRGIDGYRFIDQMDYAEYEREIDEESIKSNRAWDEYCRARAAHYKSDWEKSQKVDFSNFGDVGRDARQTWPQEVGRIAKKPALPGSGLKWILMLASFGTAFLFTHNLIATLILGWILACALYTFRWLRRLIGGLLIFSTLLIGWALISPKPTPEEAARDWRTERILERQRYAEEYIRTHPPSKAVINTVTRAAEAGIITPTPTPAPTPAFSGVFQSETIQPDPSLQVTG